MSDTPVPAPNRRMLLKTGAALGLTLGPMAQALAQAGGEPPARVLDFTTYADVAKAEAEGALIFYCAENEAGVAAIAAAFAKDFPRIRTSYFRAQTGALYTKLLAERGAGVFNVDVVQFSEIGPGIDFQKKGGYTIYHSPETAHYRPQYLSDPPGAFFWVTISLAGIAYNTQKLAPAEVPKSWSDIRNPAFKGHISCKIAASGMQYITWYMLRKLYGDDFWKTFGSQLPHALDSRVKVFDRLSKGDDCVASVGELGGYALFKKRGAPVELVIPAEGLTGAPVVAGIADRAPHPEAAKLFIDWYMSKRGQSFAQAEPNLIYPSVRDAMPPVPALGKRLADFKLLVPTDWVDYAAQHQTFLDQWNDVLGL